jgi:hypothetical protein
MKRCFNAREHGRGEQRPITLWTSREQAGELGLAQHPLLARKRLRPLVPIEPLERVRADVAAAVRVAEDTGERAQDALDRPRR